MEFPKNPSVDVLVSAFACEREGRAIRWRSNATARLQSARRPDAVLNLEPEAGLFDPLEQAGLAVAHAKRPQPAAGVRRIVPLPIVRRLEHVPQKLNRLLR
jgi:hypothetical protein